MNNWTNIHPDFNKSWGEFLKKQWQNNGFDYQQTKAWIKDFNLVKPREYDLAWWLVNKQNKSPEKLNSDEIEKLREQLKQDWKDISSDWSLEIQVEITQWIKKGFNAPETKQWLEVGLTLKESDFATQLKEKGHNSSETNIREIIEEAKKEYNEKDTKAQNWLDQEYPQEKRTNLKKLNISRKNLAGSLQLEGFTNLEELHCYDNNLTSLDCSDCPQLKVVRCQKNNLTSLNLTNCSNIIELYCNRNNLTDLDFLQDLSSEKLETLLVANNNFSASDLTPFARFSNLKNLGLGNWFKTTIEQNIYNRFSGSLKPLEKLTNLEDLDIAGTDIDQGLEYLPNNIQVFYCFTKESSESKAEIIAKELRKYGETDKDDDGDENFANPLQTWREFLNSPVQQWLDENYPKKERNEVAYLDISKKNLSGALKLEGFTNLRILNCSNNQLTNLNLSDCPNLTNLDCSNNRLYDLYFLKSLNKLEYLMMRSNPKLVQQSLKFLTSLTELEELNVSDCPLEGNLKPLTNLSKLVVLRISNTNIAEGLEHLPEGCKILYCNSDYPHRSIKIVKELDKSKCSDDDKNGIRYYNLDKWREDKQNSIAVSVIPSERLFVIRSNIKKFVNKWGIKEENEIEKLETQLKKLNERKNTQGENEDLNKEIKDIKEKLDQEKTNWKRKVEKFSNEWIIRKKEDKDNLSELSKLQSPEEFNIYWYTGGVKWLARAGATTGGILALNDNATLGGALAASFPLVEAAVSRVEEKLYDAKENKWEGFIEDTKNLLDNYHELLGILEKIERKELGVVNKALNDLRVKTEAFLEKYDKDENKAIDISELIEKEKRKEFGTDLSKEKQWAGGSQLGRIVKVMKKLEENIINYRQAKTSGERSLTDKKQELAWGIIDRLEEYSSPEFDAEKVYNSKGGIDNHWQGKSSWQDYLEGITKEDTKNNGFVYVRENLLYPLAELIIEKLKDTNVEELLKNYEENKKELEEKFVKKVQDLCDICQELNSEKLNKVIKPLKNQVDDFAKYLERYKINNDKENKAVLELKDEESKLEKIVEVVKNLEKQVKTCYEALTNKEEKIEEDIQQHQASVEIPIDK